MYFPKRYPMRIVARRKTSGWGDHYGVQLPNGDVAHLAERGEEIVSFAQFAEGQPVKEICRICPHQYTQTLRRVHKSTRNPGQYRLLDRNCEHYANWLIGNKPESPQVKGLAVLSLIALGLRLVA